ncbi:uncharacterized protein LOC126568925 [Anopheles aquasalis]|uniref:uncharacterized protein LOC126568925 n=1 Tax=Anopheles aquasalis TaxID=42839 RepID=UPI00215AD60B|nr:uncharacterized protein LOC126568925 [Anopheles aquasalis]
MCEFGKDVEITIEMEPFLQQQQQQQHAFNSLDLKENEKLLNNMEILATFAYEPKKLLELLPSIKDRIESLGGDKSTSDEVECALELAKIASKREDIPFSQSLQAQFPEIPWENIRNNESPADIGRRIEERLQFLMDKSAFKAVIEQIKKSLE